MTREQATQNINEIDFLTWQIDIIEDMLDQIFNDHETAIEILMKANEEEISRHFNELKAKDELLDKLHKAYAEADYECKALNAKLAKKDEKIEKLKKQYHQCLDDYIKCAERKEQQ